MADAEALEGRAVYTQLGWSHMPKIEQGRSVDGTGIVRLSSDLLTVDLAPSIGGRLVSLVSHASDYEFLWRNERVKLAPQPAGSAYDAVFYGGIDELLPNDAPETINGVAQPDHGELWTLPLEAQVEGDELVLRGRLPLLGFDYEKRVRIAAAEPIVQLRYRLTNTGRATTPFLWKMHAALNIAGGDRIVCPARQAEVLDPAWSRWKTPAPFAWPNVPDVPDVQRARADLVPAKDGTVDFLCLSDLERGEMGWESASGNRAFTYRFDARVFPYAWYFASYGGFDDHYTAVLEPCTCRGMSVNQSYEAGQCLALGAGETLETEVSIVLRDR